MKRSVETLPGELASQASILDGAPRVIVYGEGNAGHAVHRCLKRRGIVVPCFLDRRAVGKQSWEGVPVLQPDDKAIPLATRSQVPVVIAVFNRSSDPREIVDRLHSSGYSQVLTLAQAYDHLLPEMENWYGLAPRAYYRKYAAAITEAADLWEDEISRELYAAVLEYRLSGDHQVLPEPRPDCQYVPDDIPVWRTPIRLVDCGAYPGDTPRSLLNMGLPVEAIAMFEPDCRNFAVLRGVVRREFPADIDVTLWPCAVGPRTEPLQFAGGRGESSRLESGRGESVQCVALDEVIPRFRPTLVKMDVEGAEMGALEGARKIIDDDRPALAVCLYHRPEDLWQIPLALKQWESDYSFFLRLHGFNGLELVLYATRTSAVT